MCQSRILDKTVCYCLLCSVCVSVLNSKGLLWIILKWLIAKSLFPVQSNSLALIKREPEDECWDVRQVICQAVWLFAPNLWAVLLLANLCLPPFSPPLPSDWVSWSAWLILRKSKHFMPWSCNCTFVCGRKEIFLQLFLVKEILWALSGEMFSSIEIRASRGSKVEHKKH